MSPLLAVCSGLARNARHGAACSFDAASPAVFWSLFPPRAGSSAGRACSRTWGGRCATAAHLHGLLIGPRAGRRQQLFEIAWPPVVMGPVAHQALRLERDAAFPCASAAVLPETDTLCLCSWCCCLWHARRHARPLTSWKCSGHCAQPVMLAALWLWASSRGHPFMTSTESGAIRPNHTFVRGLDLRSLHLSSIGERKWRSVPPVTGFFSSSGSSPQPPSRQVTVSIGGCS